MVIDGGQLESQRDRLSMFCELLTHVVLDIVEEGDLVTVRDQHITVDFVNQNLIDDIGFDLTCLLDHLIEGLACTFEIRVVSINDVYQSTA